MRGLLDTRGHERLNVGAAIAQATRRDADEWRATTTRAELSQRRIRDAEKISELLGGEVFWEGAAGHGE
jgi:hypothetical protein